MHHYGVILIASTRIENVIFVSLVYVSHVNRVITTFSFLIIDFTYLQCLVNSYNMTNIERVYSFLSERKFYSWIYYYFITHNE